MVKSVIGVCSTLLLSGCAFFFKFSGTDKLYREGRENKEAIVVNRRWCSQCGCDALEAKKIVKGHTVVELLLNCTKACPPGDTDYKIERDVHPDGTVTTRYYFLFFEKVPGLQPLTDNDKLLVEKIRLSKNDFFFQQECKSFLRDFAGCRQVDSVSFAYYVRW